MSDETDLDPVLHELAVSIGKQAAQAIRLATVRAAAHLADPTTYPLPAEGDAVEHELAGLVSKLPAPRKQKLVDAATAELVTDLDRRVPALKQLEKKLPKLPGDTGARLKLKEAPPGLGKDLQKALGHNRWNGVRFFIESVECRLPSGMGILNDRVDVAGVALDPSKFAHVYFESGDKRIDPTPGTQTISDYIGSMGSDDRLPGGIQAWMSFTPTGPTPGQPFATWPRTYTVVMSLVVEADSSEEIEGIAKKILDKASSAAASAIGTALGAVVGTALGAPGGLVTMALGALIGAAVGAALGELVKFIADFFETHVSSPITYKLELPATLGYPPGFTPVSEHSSVTPVTSRRVMVNRGDYMLSTYWDLAGFTPPPEISIPRVTTSAVKELGKLDPARALACWDAQLYALLGDGRLLVRGAEKSNEAWASLGTMAPLRSLAALNGKLYASTDDGRLVARPATRGPGDWTDAGALPRPDIAALAGFRDTSLYALAPDGAVYLGTIGAGPPSWSLVGAAIGARTLGVSWRGSSARGWGLFTAIEDAGAPPELAFKVGDELNGAWRVLGMRLPGVAAMTGTTISNNSGALYFSSDDGVVRMLPTQRIT